MEKYKLWWISSDILFLEMASFWESHDAEEFNHRLRSFVHVRRGTSFHLLADLSRLAVQSMHIVSLQEQSINIVIGAGLDKVVIIGASPLLKLQIKRAAGNNQPYFVDSKEDAFQFIKL